MRTENRNKLNRRLFIKGTAGAAAGAFLGIPALVPSSVLGADAPSNRLNMGCIGVGRMGRSNLKGFLQFDRVKAVAVCDVDANRAKDAKKIIDDYYSGKTGKPVDDCRTATDFREIISRPDIDFVSIVTPDHWHAIPAIEAARRGKDIFIEKPLTYTIEEGRILSDTVRRYGRILQVNSWQRSVRDFRFACELVRNGRIGELTAVKVGIGIDPGCEPQPEMPVPENLDYNLWLGPAAVKPYTEKRVHPQQGYSRPGWLRVLDYCHGMITGWGAHHNDIAQWGLGKELTGPVEIEGTGHYHETGLWDVHGEFSIDYTYDNGIVVNCAHNKKNPQGVTFEGTEGWVYVKRGKLDAHPKSLLKSKIGPDAIHLYESDDHKGNFLECIKSRKDPVASVEIGHRSNTVCVLGSIAMQLGRKLKWNPDKEEFIGDPEANMMRSRTMRAPWRV